MTRRDGFGLAAFLLLCFAVSALGGAITATSVSTWYQTLERSVLSPPDWVFAPVWTTIYLFMAIAGWRVWRQAASHTRRQALVVFCLQLALNLLWSFLFFGLQQIGWSLVEIVILLFAIILNTVLFWRQDRIAGILFIPYAAWVSYATILTAFLWLLNSV
ncbi:TspO/MBR family protein [Pelagibius sp. Alg239-R121]|uniref:TspO/MBR family protein n=1 Tax=Pelagibius sp. Alg239-R121 TaxID=2993448 RepID=UPI0024A6FF3B|nr:TspO/MBR family protein [Pelagibius sp. Alg239-R121]